MSSCANVLVVAMLDKNPLPTHAAFLCTIVSVTIASLTLLYISVGDFRVTLTRLVKLSHLFSQNSKAKILVCINSL